MSTSTSTLDIILNIIKKGTGDKQAAKGLKDLAAQAAAAGAILVTFGATVKKVFDFGEEGAQLERLADAGDSLAASLGGNMDEIVSKVRAASLGMVSNADIIAGANRAMMLGIGADADKMASLMEVAAFRARAMGISTTQAFNDIVTGVGRMSPLILDNLGIIVDSKTAYQEYADSIGVSVSALTAAQKKQILLNTVLAEGQSQIAAAGGMALDAAGKFERLDASWTNFIDSLKKGVAGPTSNVVEALDWILFGTQHLTDALIDHAGEVGRTATSYQDYISELERAADATGYTIDAEGNLVEQYMSSSGPRTRVIKENYALSESQFAVNQMVQDGVPLVDGWASSLISTTDATSTAAGATEDMNQALLRVQKSYGELIPLDNESIWNLALASGASWEELDRLAESLGIASSAEIEATRTAYGYTDALGNGTLTADQYKGAMDSIAISLSSAANQTDAARAANDELVSSMGGSAGAARDFSGALHGVQDAASAVTDALNNIPSYIHTEIDVHLNMPERAPGIGPGFQHGTSFAPGGMSWVGESGPELMYVPRGAQIASAGESKRIYNQQQYNQGGNTYIINDPLTAAVMMEQAQQQAMNNLTGGIM